MAWTAWLWGKEGTTNCIDHFLFAMDDIILSCAIVGDWRIFTIEVNSAETLASVKLKVHANGRSRITKFDEDHGDLM